MAQDFAKTNYDVATVILEIYRMMLADKRYGLSVNLIATKVSSNSWKKQAFMRYLDL